jgi:hypothetical protein
MNPFEFVLALVLMIGVLTIIKHRMGIRSRGCSDSSDEDSAETVRLRDEVKMLQERLKVLERITVEKENSLAREIESLRDR